MDEKEQLEREKVIVTLFLCNNSDKKPVFSTRSGIFSRFEQVSDILLWAHSKKGLNDRILKLEMTQNER